MYSINESEDFPANHSFSVRKAKQFYENMNNPTNSRYDEISHPPSRRRTAPAGSSLPHRDPNFSELNLSERQPGLNYSNEVELYNVSRIPLSYNLRKNIPPEYTNAHTVAQYYPGLPNSFQPVYRIPRANSPRSDYIYTNPVPENHSTSADLQDQYGRNISAIGATSGTMVTVPETDIIDSSAEEDEVIKDCDNEDFEDHIDYENDGGVSSSDEVDDPEVLALFEREQIVEKYEKGPEQEGIDPWENPDFELYHKTDRFGFIHKDGLTKQEIERKEQIKERRRCLKWDAMYKEWEHREPTKMKERIWKGIPESYRIRAWSRMLQIEEYKRGNETVYQELLVRGQLLSREVKQIDLDVNRTYRDNVAFMKRYDISQKRLFHILTAYSMYNTDVGYCQGMNHIVALLIMYMSDDEDAFWGLHSLLANKKYSMHGFFVPSFPKLRKFEDHFLNRVLPKYAPRVHKHFERLMLPPIYLPKWWFGCFLDRVPFKLVLRIWDVFLFLGDGVLIAMALNIFKMHEKKVIKMSMEQFMDFIQRELPIDFGYADDQVMDSLKRWLERLQDDKMALPPRKDDDFPAQQSLGLVLKRSLVDIRMDIAEIHSRSSRANSLAGRSPVPLRSRRSQKPNEKSALSQSVTALPTPSSQMSRPNASDSDAKPVRPSATPPVDGFKRKPSFRNGRSAAPLPIPDADGFVPLSATKNRHSLYDNVTPSTTPSSGTRLPTHSRETSSDRVHRAANNVTYIQLGDDERVPSPPPDYDMDELR